MYRILYIFGFILLFNGVLNAQSDFYIRGIAWGDSNGNGLQDVGELALSGVSVSLIDATNTVIETRTTALDGRYEFRVAIIGDYRVAFTTPIDHLTSPQNAGNDALDSDIAFDGRSDVVRFDTNSIVNNTPVPFNPATTNTYFTNPGMGWQQTPGRPDPLLPETVVFANRADISWRILNPAENVYDWSALDSRLNQAIADGKLFSFRIYSMRGEAWGGHQMPDYVLANGAELINGAPNYSNCVYQTEWARFVNALRQRYDGNPDIAYIDISGYSDFNEWSWNAQTQPDDDYPNNLSLDGQARQRLADMFIGGSHAAHECDDSGTTRTLAYNHPGFSQTQLIMPYAGIRQSLWYVTGRRDDVGIRYDCLGRPGDNVVIHNQIGDVIDQTWQNAPIVFELCPGTVNYAEMQNLLALSHGTLVHDNVNQRNAAATENAMRYAGYRYTVNGTIPAEVATNDTFDVTMNWQNIGYAPAYQSMGNDFELRVYLLDATGAIRRSVSSGISPNDWMPAADIQNGTAPAYPVAESFSTAGLTPGTYDIQVGILNRRTNEHINLDLAVANTVGRYSAGTIQIVDATGSNTDAVHHVDAGFIPPIVVTPLPTLTPILTPTPAPVGVIITPVSASAGTVAIVSDSNTAISDISLAESDIQLTRIADINLRLAQVEVLPATGETPVWRPVISTITILLLILTSICMYMLAGCRDIVGSGDEDLTK